MPDTAENHCNCPSPDSPLYTLAAHPITEFAYRTFARTVVGNLRSARVFGIPVNGRIAVYYSPEDISAGLVGQPTDGIGRIHPRDRHGHHAKHHPGKRARSDQGPVMHFN